MKKVEKMVTMTERSEVNMPKTELQTRSKNIKAFIVLFCDKSGKITAAFSEGVKRKRPHFPN